MTELENIKNEIKKSFTKLAQENMDVCSHNTLSEMLNFLNEEYIRSDSLHNIKYENFDFVLTEKDLIQNNEYKNLLGNVNQRKFNFIDDNNSKSSDSNSEDKKFKNPFETNHNLNIFNNKSLFPKNHIHFSENEDSSTGNYKTFSIDSDENLEELL